MVNAFTFVLKVVATICGVATLLTYLNTRYSSSAPRPLGKPFTRSVAAIAIIYLLFLLSETATRLPIGKRILRWECLNSSKGGKRPYGDTGEDFLNPCYNRTNETSSADAGTFPFASLCSTSDTDGDISKSEYIPATRDCQHAQTSLCALENPCTPCELSRRDEFHNSERGWDRCQACSLRNNHGECNFKDGVGPYCWKDAESWEVVPCKICCTEGTPVQADGVCY